MNTVIEPYTPVLDTAGAYADGDSLVDAETEIKGVFDVNSTLVTLKHIAITDLAAQAAPLAFLFFNAVPAATTFAKNVALTVNDTDLANLAGRGFVVAADYEAFVANAMGEASDQVVIRKGATTSLWVVGVSRGTPTYVTAADIVAYFTFDRENIN